MEWLNKSILPGGREAASRQGQVNDGAWGGGGAIIAPAIRSIQEGIPSEPVLLQGFSSVSLDWHSSTSMGCRLRLVA